MAKAKYLLLSGNDCTRQGNFSTEVIYDTLEQAQEVMRKEYNETAEGYLEEDETIETLESEFYFYCNDMGAGCPCNGEIDTADEWWKIIEIKY